MKKLLDSVKESKESDELRNCCTIISINYLSQPGISYEFEAKMKTVELVSSIGGLIGMWMGMSMLDFYISFQKYFLKILRKLSLCEACRDI